MTYPADVQAALDYAALEGWTTERYQAVLAIALGHLEVEPPHEEPLIQWAVEPIALDLGGMIDGGSIYLVCPACGPVAQWEVVTDGSAYAWFDSGELVRGDSSDFTGDADYFLCLSCSCRYAAPTWLWEAGWCDWDKVEWGDLVTD